MKNTALIIVDFQNDYFQGGRWELEGTDLAANKAAKLLKVFRENKMPVVHVRHEFTTDDAPFFAPNSEGAKIHSTVKNVKGEPVVLKHNINSFRDTNLKEILDNAKVDSVLVCGAMSHLCIDSVVRTANDFGYNCTVAHDACATLKVEFDGVNVSAKHVHATIMSALAFAFASVESTDALLKKV
jgi:nicotinamidase-related amidase